MPTVTANLTDRLTRELDALVASGLFSTRSDAVKAAVRDMLQQCRIQRLGAAIDEDISWGTRPT